MRKPEEVRNTSAAAAAFRLASVSNLDAITVGVVSLIGETTFSRYGMSERVARYVAAGWPSSRYSGDHCGTCSSRPLRVRQPPVEMKLFVPPSLSCFGVRYNQRQAALSV